MDTMQLIQVIISAIGLFTTLIIATIGDIGIISYRKRTIIKYTTSKPIKFSNGYAYWIKVVNKGRRYEDKIFLKIDLVGARILEMQIEEGVIEKYIVSNGGINHDNLIINLLKFPQKRSCSLQIVTNNKTDMIVSGESQGEPISILEDECSRTLQDKLVIILGLFAWTSILVNMLF